MRLASFRSGGRSSYGAVSERGVTDLGKRLGTTYPALIDLIAAGPAGLAAARAAGDAVDLALDAIEYVPPVPGTEKIICVGINYPERASEYKDGREKPKYPNLFVRFPGSLVGHEEPIVRPKHSEKFDYEGEIVIVIGKTGRDVSREDALGMIFGLTLGKAACEIGSGTERSTSRKARTSIGRAASARGSFRPTRSRPVNRCI
jgi:2-keto-4-pentenoate hydratase/2-oxohepta-3-ene-1,7-dioic acid hydratase in catechol pathway